MSTWRPKASKNNSQNVSSPQKYANLLNPVKKNPSKKTHNEEWDAQSSEEDELYYDYLSDSSDEGNIMRAFSKKASQTKKKQNVSPKDTKTVKKHDSQQLQTDVTHISKISESKPSTFSHDAASRLVALTMALSYVALKSLMVPKNSLSKIKSYRATYH
jgi:hypothetical protein